jgi:hypothetical protein
VPPLNHPRKLASLARHVASLPSTTLKTSTPPAAPPRKSYPRGPTELRVGYMRSAPRVRTRVQAYDKLQFDFPVVDTAELRALEAEYTAAVAHGGFPAAMPVTAALLANVTDGANPSPVCSSRLGVEAAPEAESASVAMLPKQVCVRVCVCVCVFVCGSFTAALRCLEQCLTWHICAVPSP